MLPTFLLLAAILVVGFAGFLFAWKALAPRRSEPGNAQLDLLDRALENIRRYREAVGGR